MKRCSKCGTQRPLLMFYREPGCADGYRSQCKVCEAARNKRWYEANKAKTIARVQEWRDRNREAYLEYQREYNSADARKLRDRAGHLRRKYGMTIEDYDRMLEEQGGGCAICGRPPREDISLHVDHDHETGRVRGLLCFPCNNTLGDFKDDPARLYAAAEYLTKDTELAELIRQRALALVDARLN